METIRPSFRAVASLLSTAGLPTDDLPDDLEHFLGRGDPEHPDGVVGLEIFGEDALLRSLVVADAARGRGLGRQLVAAAEDHARERGVRNLFLLTDTAERFFGALGYAAAARDLAPEPVKATRQFTELCPASAAFMVKRLVV